MKRKLLIPLSLIMLTFIIALSCTKPPVEPPKKSPLEILTGSAWTLDELRFLQNNTPQYYKRGGNNNTHDYSQELLVFKANNTGIKYESWGTQSFTWAFNNDDKTEIKIILNENPALEIIWEHVVYDKDLITYIEYYKRQATNSLASGRRIPIAIPSGKVDKF